eukprot:scaffold1692_cov74-Skeletonema_menzelii.AAC.4
MLNSFLFSHSLTVVRSVGIGSRIGIWALVAGKTMLHIMTTLTPMRPKLRSAITCVAFSLSIASMYFLYLQTTMILNTTSFNGADDNNNHGRPRRRLIHVVSPFVTKDTTSLFAPLSEEQFSMLVSIQNAQQEFINTTMTNYTGFDSVLIVCAVLPDEYDTLHDILAPYCQRIRTLSRHTGTEYPEIMPETKLPFLQDIVDADICLHKYFFTNLSRELARSKRKALSINRKVLQQSGFNVSSSLNDGKSTPHSAAMKLWQQAHDYIDKGKYAKHGGYDCFIMHASVVRSLNFGKQFVGFPFWGNNIDFALHIMADGYENVKSKETSWGTYHVGNDGNWSTSNTVDVMEWKKFSKEEVQYLAWCPIVSFPPKERITLQNVINCGKWFRPASNDKSPMVPAFVNDGYDTRVYPKFLGKKHQIQNFGNNGYRNGVDAGYSQRSLETLS